MKKLVLLTATLGMCMVGMAQRNDTIKDINKVFRNTLYLGDMGKSMLGGYAQLEYVQQTGTPERHNGKVDVHRMVLFIGHKFNEKASFFTEWEVEHANEFWIEQAFLEYKLGKSLNSRAGLLIIPMGIVNEYHEPTTFNGVTRPQMDKVIIPTTWRELGTGFAGRNIKRSVNYQLYVTNGGLSYSNKDGGKLISGEKGLRNTRQKGVKPVISGHPNFSGKINWYGMKGMNIGLAGYTGRMQSTAYDGISRTDAVQKAVADSTTVGMTMVGLDYRYKNKKFTSRGQLIYTTLRGAGAYNAKVATDPIGSSMMGYYVEAAYDVMSMLKKTSNSALDVFVRFEQFDTHLTTPTGTTRNADYARQHITTGLHFRPSQRTSYKFDYQNQSDANGNVKHQFAVGVGVWF